MNKTLIFILITAFILMITTSITIGLTFNHFSGNQNKKPVESRLAWEVLHTCGKGWHMVDWAPLGSGEIIVDCAPDQANGKVPYYATKSVITGG